MNVIEDTCKKTKGDYVHAIAKATVGAVPMVGSFLAEFVECVIAPPYERRREEWVKSVAEKIQFLESQIEGFKLISILKCIFKL